MIVAHEGVAPQVGQDVFVAGNATVLGRVSLGDGASIWYGCVLRGDVGSIAVGARANIQDLSVVHVSGGRFDTRIGADVTVGHRAIIHGCTVEDLVLVGMGAILLDGVHVERECLIGAGAVVTPGTRIPRGSLALGSPARVVRSLRPEELQQIRDSGAHYVALARTHVRL